MALMQNLNISSTPITDGNFSSMPSLQNLDISSTNISNLNVTFCSNLQSLSANNVSIPNVNLSFNNNLSDVFLVNAGLTYLNLANGNSAGIYYCDMQNNPSLSCIQVDDPSAVASLPYWVKDATASYNTNCPLPCTISFTSNSLEQRLLDHGVGITGSGIGIIDTNSDGLIQCAEATAYTGKILLNGFSSSDLNGLSEFTGITEIYIGNILSSGGTTALDFTPHPNLSRIEYNGSVISSINVTNNTLLHYLNVSNSAISNIDVSNNTNLDTLQVSNNNLATIDVSNNVNLLVFTAGNNDLSTVTGLNNLVNLKTCFLFLNPQLTTIDINNCADLETFWLNQTGITALNVTQNTNLLSLNASNTGINSLDISQNSALKQLNVSSTSISSIDVSMNPSLEDLSVSSTSIVAIDLSQNQNLINLEVENVSIPILDFSQLTNLEVLYVSNSPLLEKVSIANGNNTLIYEFDATSCPNLSCIQVDDVMQAQSSVSNSYWFVDDINLFNLDCGFANSLTEKEKRLIEVYPNPANEKIVVLANDIKKLSLFDVTGKLIRTTSFSYHGIVGLLFWYV